MTRRWLIRFAVTVALVLAVTALIAGMPGGLGGPEYAPRFSFPAYFHTLWSLVKDVVRGSIGSTRYGENPFVVSLALFGRSLVLLWKALAIALGCGLLLGLVAGRRLRAFRLAATVALSTPDFLVVMGLQLLIIHLARAGVPVPGWSAGAGARSLLPSLVLALFPTAYVAQITAAARDRVMGEEYIRTAVAKGLGPSQVLRRHALRNVLAEVVPSLSGLWAVLISDLIIVEYFFLWPGAGHRMVLCLADPRKADPRMAIALALVFAAVYLILDAASMLAWRLLDPRTRGGEAS